MGTTAPPNPAGEPIPESIGDIETESARSRSVPGAELPLITAREGQVALTEQALRTHTGSENYPLVGYPQTTNITSRTPLSYQPLPTVIARRLRWLHRALHLYQRQQNLNVSNLNVSVDASLLAETANARHTEVVQRIHSKNREQMSAMELNAMSHVAQLRLEHAQLHNRAKFVEEEAAQNLQSGRHAVAHHQIEAAAATEQAEHLRMRLQSAEATASHVVAQVEAKAARRAQASQADATARNDEFARLRSEMQEMMRMQAQNMDQLKKDNAELRSSLAEAEAESPNRQQGPELPPGLDTHRIHTPPEPAVPAEGETRQKDDKKKTSKKSKKHKKDDSSASSSSIDNKLLFKVLKKVMKSNKDDKEEARAVSELAD